MRDIVSENISAAESLHKTSNFQANQHTASRQMAEQQSMMPMVPEQEFENLKQLTFQIEKEATETIERKDGHIQSLIDEIQYLKESHKVDLEEQKLHYELKVTDLELKVKRSQERLEQFESQSEFEDILQTYNNQMCNLENENNILIQEVKRACKIESM